MKKTYFSIIKILLEMDPNAKLGLLVNGARDLYHSKNVFNRLCSAALKHLRQPPAKLGQAVLLVEDRNQNGNQTLSHGMGFLSSKM